jgi:hypothetical protein
MRTLCSTVVLCVALTVGAADALAGDGRLEINQSCIATGCFPGDDPGFPVETQAGRSYVLTSSLTVTNVNTTAVSLANRAVLDLNGFEIAGPTTCSGAPATCSAAGVEGGVGVYAQAHTTIRNGTIRGMGVYGIAGEVGVTVEQVLVANNASGGIYLNYGSDGPEAHLIRGVRVVGNGGTGIFTAAGQGGIGTLVTDCVVHGNKDAGLAVSRTHVTNSTIARNGGAGVSGTESSLGGSTLIFNNGGNAQPQTAGSILQIGTNVCGTDTVCP